MTSPLVYWRGPAALDLGHRQADACVTGSTDRRRRRGRRGGRPAPAPRAQRAPQPEQRQPGVDGDQDVEARAARPSNPAAGRGSGRKSSTRAAITMGQKNSPMLRRPSTQLRARCRPLPWSRSRVVPLVAATQRVHRLLALLGLLRLHPGLGLAAVLRRRHLLPPRGLGLLALRRRPALAAGGRQTAVGKRLVRGLGCLGRFFRRNTRPG